MPCPELIKMAMILVRIEFRTLYFERVIFFHFLLIQWEVHAFMPAPDGSYKRFICIACNIFSLAGLPPSCELRVCGSILGCLYDVGQSPAFGNPILHVHSRVSTA